MTKFDTFFLGLGAGIALGIIIVTIVRIIIG